MAETAIRLRAPATVGITALLVVVPVAHAYAAVSLLTLIAVNFLQPWSQRLYD